MKPRKNGQGFNNQLLVLGQRGGIVKKGRDWKNHASAWKVGAGTGWDARGLKWPVHQQSPSTT